MIQWKAVQAGVAAGLSLLMLWLLAAAASPGLHARSHHPAASDTHHGCLGAVPTACPDSADSAPPADDHRSADPGCAICLFAHATAPVTLAPVAVPVPPTAPVAYLQSIPRLRVSQPETARAGPARAPPAVA